MLSKLQHDRKIPNTLKIEEFAFLYNPFIYKGEREGGRWVMVVCSPPLPLYLKVPVYFILYTVLHKYLKKQITNSYVCGNY